MILFICMDERKKERTRERERRRERERESERERKFLEIRKLRRRQIYNDERDCER